MDFVDRLKGIVGGFLDRPRCPELAREVELAVRAEAQRRLGAEAPRDVIVRFDAPTGAILVGFDLHFQARIVAAMDQRNAVPSVARVARLMETGFAARKNGECYELVSRTTGEAVWSGTCPVELIATAELLSKTSKQEPS